MKSAIAPHPGLCGLFQPRHRNQWSCRRNSKRKLHSFGIRDGIPVRLTAGSGGPNGGLIPLGGGGTGRVWLGYSLPAMEKDLKEQTSRWMHLEWRRGRPPFVGLFVSFILGRQMAAPLKKIREGTHLVREGQLGSLVEVKGGMRSGTWPGISMPWWFSSRNWTR